MSALMRMVLLVLEEVMHFFFPLSDDERLIKDLHREQLDRRLRVQQQGDVIVLTSFKEADIRAIIHLVKFHRHPQAIELAGSLLHTWLLAHTTAPSTIIPVPLSSRRLRERGFNQAELIAREAVTTMDGYLVDTNILTRNQHTKPQSGLPRQERLGNVAGAFRVAPKVTTLADQHIILVDDVMTTGATLKAAKAVLLPLKPASIRCVAIAH